MSKNNFIGYRVKKIIPVFFVILFGYTFSLAQDQFKYNDKGKRNPFIPLVTSEGRLLKLDKRESEGGLSLEGIIFDKYGRSFAIVNGNVVGVGDVVAGYQVLKIEQKKVIFIKSGETVSIELKAEDDQ